MKIHLLFLALFCLCAHQLTAQELEQKWVSNITSQDINAIDFSDNTFTLTKNDSVIGSGDYMFQNNLIIAYFTQPKDTIRRFKISSLTDTTLVLTENSKTFKFLPTIEKETIIPESQIVPIIPSQGFTFSSLWRGALGMFALVFIAFLFSNNRRAINWKTVGIGLAFQLLIAVGVLKIGFVKTIFEKIGGLFISVLDFTRAGSKFLFEGLVVDMDTFGFIFAFQVLPTIIFFSALTSVLFYLGLIQKLVKLMAMLLTKLLKISGAESLSVAGNIFLGQTEAPLLIKAYLEKMTKSEILLVMIGGMATVAGAVLAAYIGFLGGEDEALKLFYAKHLLAASVMAAPGAIVISKILYPQTEKINTEVEVSKEKIGSNILDAIANGTTEGLRLAVNVGAMLLVFVAFIAMANGILGGIAAFDGLTVESLNINWKFTSLNTVIANNTPYDGLSLEFILGYAFAPLMWLIGVAKEDMALMGQLLGIKLAASEFIGYIQLAELKDVANATHLKFEKSIIMATYMLCGFANFASIGIQIGGIGSLAPGQRKQLSKFGMKKIIYWII